MGFGPPQARQALKETGGDMERAVEWLFNHPDAQGDFGDGPTAAGGDDAATAGPKELPGSSTLPAEFQLNSIICHKGTSVHTG
jgi:ubiquitin carboxyl-terminal hydrolase 5/13